METNFTNQLEEEVNKHAKEYQEFIKIKVKILSWNANGLNPKEFTQTQNLIDF